MKLLKIKGEIYMIDIYMEFCVFCKGFSDEEKSDLQLMIHKVEQVESKFGVVPEYYSLLASLYSAIGEYSKAIMASKKEIGFASEDKSLYLLKRGCMYFDDGNYRKAAHDFEQALKLATSQPNRRERFIRLVRQSLSNARMHMWVCGWVGGGSID